MSYRIYKVPVAKATEDNIYTLEKTAEWHRAALEFIHPKDKLKSRDIPRHKQILADLEVEILTYYETHDPVHRVQMEAAYG